MPAISEEEEMEAVEDNIESKAPSSQELPLEPGFAHCARSVIVVYCVVLVNERVWSRPDDRREGKRKRRKKERARREREER